MDNSTNSPRENSSPSTSESQERNDILTDAIAEGLTESPPSREEENEPLEECSVCRNEMMDTTCLSDCVHEFCYDCIVTWLTKGAGQFCPMCKTPVKYIKKKGTDDEITLQQIQTDIEPAATASADLITEKRIVSRKIRSCRRLMNRIDEIIGATSDRSDVPRRQRRVEELNKMKRQCVAQLNSLQMLRDDIDHGAAKALIVSRPEFRRLIYERQVVSESTIREFNLVSRRELVANFERYRAVLNSFLTVELKSIPAGKQPRVDNENNWHFNTFADIAEEPVEVYVNRLLSWFSNLGVRDFTEDDLMQVLNNHVSRRIAATFMSELRSLLHSEKTYLEWCASVTYRIRTDIGGESVNVNDVVVVDDSIEEETPRDRIDSSRSHRHPVFLPFDRVFSGQSSSQAYTNHRRGSSSDTDQDEDIYFQNPLCIGRTAVNTFRPASHPAFPPIPPAGISWNDLTRTSESSRRNGADSIPLVNLTDDDNRREQKNSGGRNSAEGEIQVLDNDETIVLDDTIEPPQRNNESSSRKRKTESSLDDHWKMPKIDLVPKGLVEDMQQLIHKYNLPLVNALDILNTASKDAILKNANPKPRTLTAALQNLGQPSTSSNIPSAIASYMARNNLLPKFSRNGS